MIPLPHYSDKEVAVLGLSRTGAAAVQALLDSGARKVYVWDDYKQPAIQQERLSYQKPESYPWEHIEGMVVSPGIPLDNPHVVEALANGCPLLADVQMLCDSQRGAQFIGITGSNGKSTVTTLIHQMLEKAGKNTQCGGNLGITALSLNPDSDYYVLELSSYQLELCRQIPLNLGLLINVESDHTDRYPDFGNYLAAKKAIFDHPAVYALVGIDNENSRKVYEEINNAKLAVGTGHVLKHGLSLVENTIYADQKQLFAIPAHDLVEENVALSVAAALHLKLPPECICEAIKCFRGLAHRCERIRTIGNIDFINDSKATNSHAAAGAIVRYPNIHLIAGGILKDRAWGKIPLENLRTIYIYGQSRDEINEIFTGKTPTQMFNTLQEAVIAAFEDARSANLEDRTTILLSPGCASFDQFKNFEHRGEEFTRIVNTL